MSGHTRFACLPARTICVVCNGPCMATVGKGTFSENLCLDCWVHRCDKYEDGWTYTISPGGLAYWHRHDEATGDQYRTR